MGSEKKVSFLSNDFCSIVSHTDSNQPLNPVLGELFFGVWPDLNGRGETTLTVEQVSHHPPIVCSHHRVF